MHETCETRDHLCIGTWHGRVVYFARQGSNHELTPDECQRLLDGRIILLENLEIHGQTYSCCITLVLKHGRKNNTKTVCIRSASGGAPFGLMSAFADPTG